MTTMMRVWTFRVERAWLFQRVSPFFASLVHPSEGLRDMRACAPLTRTRQSHVAFELHSQTVRNQDNQVLPRIWLAQLNCQCWHTGAQLRFSRLTNDLIIRHASSWAFHEHCRRRVDLQHPHEIVVVSSPHQTTRRCSNDQLLRPIFDAKKIPSNNLSVNCPFFLVPSMKRLSLRRCRNGSRMGLALIRTLECK